MLPALVGGLFIYFGGKALIKKAKTETTQTHDAKIEQPEETNINTPAEPETPTLIITKPKTISKSSQNLNLQRRSLLIFCAARPQTVLDLLKYCRVAVGIENLRNEAELVFALNDLLAGKLLEHHNGFYAITPQGSHFINTR
jgi:hypothetical protein